MAFVHLHTHSHYSLLDGLGTVPKIVAAAKKQNMPAIALTDHGVMYGLIEFYKECRKHDVKPILGVEAYVTDGKLTDRNKDVKPYHLILLARNTRGYKNLLKLTTKAHLDGFYYKPRIDWPTLKKYSEGLIALTACLNGPLARPIARGDEKKTIKNLETLLDIFGKENLYLEMQYRPTLPDQSKVNAELKKLSKKYKLPLVATNDAHYVHTEDAQAHDVLICLQTKVRQSDQNRMSYLGEDFSILPEETMREYFSDTPEAIDNTAVIAERCTVEIELGKINLPYFEIPGGMSSDEYLRELCVAGIENRYGHTIKDAEDSFIDRLDYELDVIGKTGFADYFLIVQDFVNWAKDNGIMVGPGRGSAAGSLVSYLIGITNIDPIKYKLLFERFLNPDRIGMPDIDMDFADIERERVLQYVEHKYGKDRVAQIITFGTMAARAAIRDVGRVLGLSYGYCDRIAKLIPMFTSLEDALKKVDELREAYEQDDDAKRLLDMAKKLEGIARHASTHACAVIITKDPLTDHTPLQYSSSDPDAVISQYSMHPVEDLGLLKMDFLGLTNLTILQTAIEIIEKTTDDTIDLDQLPLNDEKAFALLQRGDTTGIFQLESDGMTRYLKKLKPTEIEDIIAMVSLYRPGPMEFIDDYISGKHGTRKISYVHPELAPILDQTYGIAVYQEQVLQIARDLAGFSYGEADILRKAVGKKIKKLLVEQSEKMIKGMINHGIEPKTAEQIWDFILPFARYGFNRSHAASYAMIAYQTAYLKSHYPAQFMAALMTADQGNTDKIAKQVHECNKMGLVVQPPDVNESFSTFSVVLDDNGKITKNIRFGLQAVKNVGHHIAKTIIRERKENGEYQSIEDFLQRITDKDLNKKSLESLIKCGALDSFGDRGQLLGNLEQLLSFNKKQQDQKERGQHDLFSDLPLAGNYAKLKLNEVQPISTFEKLSFEKELLGLYISDHPFKEYLGLISDTTTLDTIERGTVRKEEVKIAGIITAIKKIVTKSGKPMVFVTLEDSTGTVEVVVFPKLMEKNPDMWTENTYVLVNGKLSDKDGMPKVLAENGQALDESQLNAYRGKDEAHYKLWLNLPETFSKEEMSDLKQALEQFPGMMSVYIIINNGSQRKIKTTIRVNNSKDMHDRISQMIGKANISVAQ